MLAAVYAGCTHSACPGAVMVPRICCPCAYVQCNGQTTATLAPCTALLQIDAAEPDPHFYRSTRPDRLWLRRLLSGPAAVDSWALPAGTLEFRLVDTFRAFHPGRPRAFTCWSTATSARVNNHGSRIDLILTAGLSVGRPPPFGVDGEQQPQQQAGCVWVAGGDIWPQQEGSDHCPVWADFACAEDMPFPCAETGRFTERCLCMPRVSSRLQGCRARDQRVSECCPFPCSAAHSHAARVCGQAAETAQLPAACRTRSIDGDFTARGGTRLC